MSQVEETKKETSLKVRKKMCQIATPGWEKIVSRPASSWKNGGSIIKVLKNNRYRRKKRGEGKEIEIETEKRPRRWKPTWINSGGESLKITLTYSGEAKQK